MFLKIVQVVTRIAVSSFFSGKDQEPTWNVFLEHSTRTLEMENGQSAAIVPQFSRASSRGSESSGARGENGMQGHPGDTDGRHSKDDLSIDLASGGPPSLLY
jgi:hypothetical protein